MLAVVFAQLSYLLTHCHVGVRFLETTVMVATDSLACQGRFMSGLCLIWVTVQRCRDRFPWELSSTCSAV